MSGSGRGASRPEGVEPPPRVEVGAGAAPPAIRPDPPPPSWRSPAVIGRVGLVAAALALALGGALALVHRRDRRQEREAVVAEAAHVVALQAATVAGTFEAVRADVRYLVGSAALAAYLARGEAARDDLVRDYRRFAAAKRVYDQVRYLDAEGREAVRVNFVAGEPLAVPGAELQDKADRPYAAAGLRLPPGAVYTSRLDLNVERGRLERPLKPVVRFAAPVFDAGGRRRGLVVLNSLGAPLLRELEELSAASPAALHVVDEAGAWLRAPDPGDAWGDVLGHGRAFADRYPEAWTAIAAGGRGEVSTPAGVFTFATVDLAGVGEDAARPVALVELLPTRALHRQADRALLRNAGGAGVVLVLATVLAWVLAYSGRVRRHQETCLRASEARLRALSARLLDAQEAERRRLARDLHDDLGQLATAVTLQLGRALRAESDERRRRAEEALAAAERLLERTRELSQGLRPPMLDDLGLETAARALLADLEQSAGVAVEADFALESPLAPEVFEALYRILQEATTNAARHAGATSVRVALATDAERATLVVRDDGAGFDPDAVTGSALGILGMRERAELLGGRFALESAPGPGTEVRVELPLDGATEVTP